MKKLLPILVLLILFLGTSSCSKDSDTQPSNMAYPAPATQTNLPATQENYYHLVLHPPTIPGTTVRPNFTRTPRATPTALPTQWRDPTSTPNSMPGVWPEFSSSITYSNQFNGRVVGPLHFSVRYPPDWYLYPGYTVIYPGMEWQGTYIQNYERIGNIPDEGHPKPGTVGLYISAGSCDEAVEGCPVNSPLLSPGLPGTQKVTYQSDADITFWDTYLYTRDMLFVLHGYMPGRPEENADLIKTLDKILATVVLK